MTTPEPTPQRGVQRLIRTLSGRSTDGGSPTVVASEIGSSSTPLQRTVSTTSSQRRRLSVGDRLKKLGKDINKLAKNIGKSSTAGPSLDDSLGSASVDIASPTSLSGSVPAKSSKHGKLLSMVAEGEEGADAPTSNSSTPTEAEEPVQPDNLVKRLQAIIDGLPFPAIELPGKKRPILKQPKPPAKDKTGRPIPPPGATPIKDSRLIRILSSPTIMNGSRDKSRPSIWSVLESVGAPPHALPPLDEADGGDNKERNGDDDQDIFSDNSSVMVYSPLIPGQKDLVELAELVAVGVEEGAGGDQGAESSATSWTSVWPLSILYGPSASNDPTHSDLSGDVVVSPGRTSINAEGKKVTTYTVRAWVPSKQKLSVQVMWWGYRMYLPPPVMDILSDKSIEAAKRAAMITTALTWFFNNLPVNSLPIAIRPTLLLLQRIVPFLGYIGTFISWSWGTIKGYDVGYGVTLTATWILPIALIPGTWRQYDFPQSPDTSSPQPLPGDSKPAPPTSPPTSPPTDIPTTPATPGSSPPPIPVNPTPGTPATAPSLPPPTSGTPALPPAPVDPPVPSDHVEVPPALPQVAVNSKLGERLLHTPVLNTIPLPPEDAHAAAVSIPKDNIDQEKEKKKKGLFSRMRRT